MLVALIIVNYHKSDLTVRLCETLAALPGSENVRVIVVDNAGDDQSRGILEKTKTTNLCIELLAEETNWGYFGGARRGLEAVRKWREQPDWIIISNSDIEFSDANFLRHLEQLSETDVGVVGPCILSGLSSHDQNPYMLERPTAVRMHFLKWVFRFRASCFVYQMAGLLKSLIKRRHASSMPTSVARDIYAAHGSFMIFSRSYFEGGGDFSHKPFLFGEEVTVAEVCRRLTLKIRYEPGLVVSHAEHGTMGWIPNWAMLDFQREASAFCADAYFS